MLSQINGLHHITLLASDAERNNAFYTRALGLRRVKKTVNFDAPDVYHLYFGDSQGTPGTVMTAFPFPRAKRGAHGTGEVGLSAFAIPQGTLPFWTNRLAELDMINLRESEVFGQARLDFEGPDGEELALVETATDPRDGSDRLWSARVPPEAAIRGFHSAILRVQDGGATAELLTEMGYRETGAQATLRRFARDSGNGAHIIDLEVLNGAPVATSGAGAVHHIAFSISTSAQQKAIHADLVAQGFRVTEVIDRDYFTAIYFRTPEGILFEIATDTPGFTVDEDPAHLGEALQLPAQHAPKREQIERRLKPFDD
ncbi:Putative ring-cleaving dioxygenase MhqO [Aquimixticola soesokkakensis]|uniref:Putative ring-cleaving dioxygenase MhqO n=1 Tax=Aquimixticola soesokkakensis TaxID=1519096 RepID=A0A1Y5TNV3_9RHOB|nr:ring-cleaving dioxygenase [Aquimixticola soesokkakensis]SLN68406.1 Putative ring-cleaving dioxygenase MhqO [Aquimixticola soesokkakensis]